MRRQALRIGIAIGDDAMIAVVRARGVERSARVPLAPVAKDADVHAALGTAFGTLAARIAETIGRPAGPAHVHVALLPPLCDARLIELPPLRRGEAETVIRRDANRHFLGGADAPRVVAIAMPAAIASASSAEHSTSRPPVFACAAPATVVEAVRAAIAGVGWSLKSIRPAHTAWVAAATHASADGHARVIVSTIGDTAHVMRLEGETPTALRRVPARSVDEVVAILGAPRAERLDAELTAAEYAHVAGPELIPATLLAERRRRDRVLALRLAAACLVLLAGTAAAELWGAQRELEFVRARRAEIHAEVAPLLVARDSLHRLEQRVRGIEELRERAPSWTRAIFDLALLLPPDAYLTGLDASGDTITIEAAGTRAASAIQALRAAESLRDLRLQGIVERELEDGTTAVERFKLGARLSPWTPARIERPSPTATAPAAAAKLAGSTR